MFKHRFISDVWFTETKELYHMAQLIMFTTIFIGLVFYYKMRGGPLMLSRDHIVFLWSSYSLSSLFSVIVTRFLTRFLSSLSLSTESFFSPFQRENRNNQREIPHTLTTTTIHLLALNPFTLLSCL